MGPGMVQVWSHFKESFNGINTLPKNCITLRLLFMLLFWLGFLFFFFNSLRQLVNHLSYEKLNHELAQWGPIKYATAVTWFLLIWQKSGNSSSFRPRLLMWDYQQLWCPDLSIILKRHVPNAQLSAVIFVHLHTGGYKWWLVKRQ